VEQAGTYIIKALQEEVSCEQDKACPCDDYENYSDCEDSD